MKNRLIWTVLYVGMAAGTGLSQDTKLKYEAPASQAAGEAFKAGTAAVARGDLKTAHAEFAKVVRLAPKVRRGTAHWAP